MRTDTSGPNPDAGTARDANNVTAPGDEPRQIPLRQLAPAEVAELDLYQKREKIYTRKIEGFFQRLRMLTGWPLLLGYMILPWLTWNDRQLVWFDLPARHFHIFKLTFWPQDLNLLAWLLIMSAFALFFVTVWAGRVWCGYSCPQTVWTAIFMWIEQRTEGTRNQRMRLDRAPWTLEKVLRRGTKHVMWLTVGFVTGFVFVGYFYDIRALTYDLMHLQTGAWANFWMMFFTLATYVNAGWLREQVCLYMCPYARFQSVMFDRDTLIVAYDSHRGEPRGSRKRASERATEGQGDCIDCKLCVQVCPTGIDIRNGLQYECITCALCIDACNSVMKKMGSEPNLISYTSERAASGQPKQRIRPRLVGYGAALTLAASFFIGSLLTRTPLELSIIRDRNSLYSETLEGQIENTYTLHVMNMDQSEHSYRITAGGLQGLQLQGRTQITVPAGRDATLPLRVVVDPVYLTRSNERIRFTVESETNPAISRTGESRFIGPNASNATR